MMRQLTQDDFIELGSLHSLVRARGYIATDARVYVADSGEARHELTIVTTAGAYALVLRGDYGQARAAIRRLAQHQP